MMGLINKRWLHDSQSAFNAASEQADKTLVVATKTFDSQANCLASSAI